mmetsp:Transcript_16350/g.42231  ORF Transcript_16350/g.42231 Transcript_16350/m.42231 type:complete len:234 (-) Transcript_16350:50-751(-)
MAALLAAMSMNDTAPASDELRRQKWRLGMSLVALSIVVTAELVSGYLPAAMAECSTLLFGALVLKRDARGLAQGLFPFMLIAAFNCIMESVTVLDMLTDRPGAQYFLSTECHVQVSVRQHGEQMHKVMNLCSWQTVLGNIAVCAGIPLEFMCARYAWQMFKSLRVAADGMATAMLAMMDLEAARTATQGPVGALQAAESATAPRTGHAAAAGAVAAPDQGYTPYGGAPHRLVS